MAFKNLADALIEIGFQHSTNSENREKSFLKPPKIKPEWLFLATKKEVKLPLLFSMF
jgi:hypothetical protein